MGYKKIILFLAAFMIPYALISTYMSNVINAQSGIKEQNKLIKMLSRENEVSKEALTALEETKAVVIFSILGRGEWKREKGWYLNENQILDRMELQNEKAKQVVDIFKDSISTGMNERAHIGLDAYCEPKYVLRIVSKKDTYDFLTCSLVPTLEVYRTGFSLPAINLGKELPSELDKVFQERTSAPSTESQH